MTGAPYLALYRRLYCHRVDLITSRSDASGLDPDDLKLRLWTPVGAALVQELAWTTLIDVARAKERADRGDACSPMTDAFVQHSLQPSRQFAFFVPLYDSLDMVEILPPVMALLTETLSSEFFGYRYRPLMGE